MRFYDRVVRPSLFLLPAETVHELAKRAFSTGFPWGILSGSLDMFDDRLRTVVAGIDQRSPIGLSAGFDKDARALRGLSRLGFGSITVGTIMPTPRDGNPKTRLVRLPEQRALLNCMGLPSAGLDVAVLHLRRYHDARPSNGPPVIANVGGFTIDEVLSTFRATEPVADAVELDLTCPNVEVDGELSTTDGIIRTMKLIEGERTKPLLIKLPIRSTEADRRRGLEMAHAAVEIGLDGVSASGNSRVRDRRLSMGQGSLTGPPCFPNTVRVVGELRAVVGDDFPIRVSGGASDGDDVFRLLEAGASAVNVFTAFVYRGLATAAIINRELLTAMDQHGVAKVTQIGGD